jgi:hypothetical protein
MPRTPKQAWPEKSGRRRVGMAWGSPDVTWKDLSLAGKDTQNGRRQIHHTFRAQPEQSQKEALF